MMTLSSQDSNHSSTDATSRAARHQICLGRHNTCNVLSSVGLLGCFGSGSIDSVFTMSKASDKFVAQENNWFLPQCHEDALRLFATNRPSAYSARHIPVRSTPYERRSMSLQCGAIDLSLIAAFSLYTHPLELRHTHHL